MANWKGAVPVGVIVTVPLLAPGQDVGVVVEVSVIDGPGSTVTGIKSATHPAASWVLMK